jgi:hypothetical protein
MQECCANDGENEVARVRLPPVMSDALDSPVGGLQGLAWFLSALVCDEWGTVASTLLEPTQDGLKELAGRQVALKHLVYSCTSGVVTVDIASRKKRSDTTNKKKRSRMGRP